MCDLPFLILATNYGEVTGAQFAVGCAIIVLIMSGLLVGINLKEKLIPKKKEGQDVKVSPNPLPVELIKTLATLDHIDDLRREFNRGIESLRREMKTDDDGIHKRVGAISIKLATVDGKLDQVIKSVEMLVEKEVSK